MIAKLQSRPTHAMSKHLVSPAREEVIDLAFLAQTRRVIIRQNYLLQLYGSILSPVHHDMFHTAPGELRHVSHRHYAILNRIHMLCSIVLLSQNVCTFPKSCIATPSVVQSVLVALNYSGRGGTDDIIDVRYF